MSAAKRSASVNRILVATDRSQTATRAVGWAAEMAERYGAELLLLQVLPPEDPPGGGEPARPGGEDHVGRELSGLADRIAGPRGRARVARDADPSRAIVAVAEEEDVDVVVVGNVGMRGRREFLLSNVPNRVSHNATCTVIIVNTAAKERRGLARLFSRDR